MIRCAEQTPLQSEQWRERWMGKPQKENSDVVYEMLANECLQNATTKLKITFTWNVWTSFVIGFGDQQIDLRCEIGNVNKTNHILGFSKPKNLICLFDDAFFNSRAANTTGNYLTKRYEVYHNHWCLKAFHVWIIGVQNKAHESYDWFAVNSVSQLILENTFLLDF